jgi:hypothetical protein
VGQTVSRLPSGRKAAFGGWTGENRQPHHLSRDEMVEAVTAAHEFVHLLRFRRI